jgi:hypothetical protein
LVVAGQTLLTSDDQGVTWVNRGSICAVRCVDALWTGSVLVMFESRTTFRTSPDGITWTTRNLPAGVPAISYGVAVGQVFFGIGGTTLVHSADGITWRNVNSFSAPGSATALLWTGSQLVASTGSRGAIMLGE